MLLSIETGCHPRLFRVLGLESVYCCKTGSILTDGSNGYSFLNLLFIFYLFMVYFERGLHFLEC